MSNRKTIDLQVEVPELDVNDKKQMKLYSEILAKDLAEQIVAQVLSLHQADNIAYWTGVLKGWEVQDRITQIKQDKITQYQDNNRRIKP